jgi:hypothetical protein
MNRSVKIIIGLALLVGIVSALQYSSASLSDSMSNIGKNYAFKQDFAEKNYMGYRVYRYYTWMNVMLPERSTLGLLVSKDDDRSYGRYQHRLNYFMYPQYIHDGITDALFAPKLSSLNLGNTKVIVLKGIIYRLKATKDDTGLFTRR